MNITNVFNAKLKYVCAKKQIPFLDIYHLLVDYRDGMNRQDWFVDETHYHYIGDLVIEKMNLG